VSSPTPSPGFVELDAPAKVNLGLRIVGVREDGYHLLESLFVPLDLCDRLRVEVDASRPEISVSLEVAAAKGAPSTEAIPTGDDNLVVRAAKAYLEASGQKAHVAVRLIKSIPSAAGLGGGSSDAAAVLRALDRLLPRGLSPAALRRVALGLGADVPFFLDPRPTLVHGIGEGLTPVEDWPGFTILLVNPGISLATAEVYGAFDVLVSSLTTAEPGSTMRAISGLRNHPSAHREHLDGLLQNDLEPAAVRLCPPVGRLRERLAREGAEGVGMSGSGATVFGVFPRHEDAETALLRLRSDPPVDHQIAGRTEGQVWARIARTGGS